MLREWINIGDQYFRKDSINSVAKIDNHISVTCTGGDKHDFECIEEFQRILKELGAAGE